MRADNAVLVGILAFEMGGMMRRWLEILDSMQEKDLLQLRRSLQVLTLEMYFYNCIFHVQNEFRSFYLTLIYKSVVLKNMRIKVGLNLIKKISSLSVLGVQFQTRVAIMCHRPNL